jgi:hypothetical protein
MSMVISVIRFWLNLRLTLLDLSNWPRGFTELDPTKSAREHASTFFSDRNGCRAP